ncbi:MAG: DUF6077 domain-containing protein [Myxococcota bacterium]|nr:DUF6077 domain-containing protein [Myxococcota bacterium]
MTAPDAPSGRTCDRLVVSLLALFAIWTVAAQFALLAHWSFHQLVLVGGSGVALALLGAGGWIGRGALTGRRAASSAPRTRSGGSPGARVGLLLLCGGCGLVSLLVSRPDLDDVGYVSRAVYFLEHPHVPLDLAYHDHGLIDFPAEYPLMLAYSLELLWAAISYLTQIPFITLYHSVGSALGGALIPAATYMAVSRFVARPHHALLGCAAVVAYLCLDGSTHRTFGNFAFVRIWQGKVMLMAVALPVFTALSVDWLRRPSWLGWLKVSTVGIAASGLSGSAFFLLPTLSLWLAAGHLLERGWSREASGRVIAYGSSLVYLVAIALVVWSSTSRSEFEYLGFSIFPETFLGQAALVLGGAPPVTGIVMAFAAGCLFLLPTGDRRFLGGWILAAVVLALNPLAMSLLVETLTTTNAYWRLFYTLPFPLLVGVGAGSLAARAEMSEFRSLCASAAALLLAAGLQFAAATKTPLAGERFALGPKLAPMLRLEVEAIVERARPGPMLAPTAVSSVLPILTSAHPQVVVRGYFIRHFAAEAGLPEVAESRIRAVMAVTTAKTTNLADVEVLLEQGLENVVCTTRATKNEELRERLKEAGMLPALRTPRYVLFIRSAEDAGGTRAGT